MSPYYFMQITFEDWGFTTSYHVHNHYISQKSYKLRGFLIKNSKISLNKRCLPSAPKNNKKSCFQSIEKTKIKPHSLKPQRSRDSQCSEITIRQVKKRRAHSVLENNHKECLIFSRFLSPFLEKNLAKIPEKPIEENIKTVRKFQKKKSKSEPRDLAEHNPSQSALSQFRSNLKKNYQSLLTIQLTKKIEKNLSVKETSPYSEVLATRVFADKKDTIPKIAPTYQHIKQLHRKKKELIQKRISLKMKPLKP